LLGDIKNSSLEKGVAIVVFVDDKSNNKLRKLEATVRDREQ